MPLFEVQLHIATFEIRSHRRDEMIDVTDRLVKAVADSGVADGIATVFVPHTTAGITINENADPDVIHDVLEALNVAVPHEQEFYDHNEGNSAAHVKSLMVGVSTQVIVRGGRLVLGSWQAVYFCEFDGPRTRQMHVSVNGG